MKGAMKKKKKRGGLTAALAILLLLVLAGAGGLLYYQTQYSLTLNGEEELELNLCQVFEDPGASAKRGGKDVSSQIQVTGSVNTQVPGYYVLEYRLGHRQLQRQVRVKNVMDPVLELAGDRAVYLNLGEAFEEPGFSATDSRGRDLTSKVKTDVPDFTKPGTKAGKAEILYRVTDSRGVTTEVTRQVRIMPNTEYETKGLPICMYHYVYDEENPPEDLYRRFGNYIEAGDLEEELLWLQSEGYYFPDWQEVRDYIDGRLLLPEKSIVLCFDDGAKSFLKTGIPVLEACKVPATCFMITSESGEEKIRDYQSRYVTYQSHSHNMHRNGGNVGHGGIFTVLSPSEALTDLKTSIKICGSGEAFAYPYGDYTEQCRDTVEAAGFLCAVTTQPGKAKPGMDPLLLPRVRMSMGQSLSQFQYLVQ